MNSTTWNSVVQKIVLQHLENKMQKYFSYLGPEWGGPSVCVEAEAEEEELEAVGGEVSIGCAEEEEDAEVGCEAAAPCWADASLGWPWNVMNKCNLLNISPQICVLENTPEKKLFQKAYCWLVGKGQTSSLWIKVWVSRNKFSANWSLILGSLCTDWSKLICTSTDPLLCN